jgi:PAS domain S-box-containing protein
MTRVLILDDRPINRQILTTLLAYKGMETREASDGLEGLQVAREWMPDLVIVDIDMPVMNGCEFVNQLHADTAFQSTAVIFYTASYETAEAARMADECRVEHVLMKPSEPELILTTIERALGRDTGRFPSAEEDAGATEFVRLHTDPLRITAVVDFQLEIAGQRRPADILNHLAFAGRTIISSRRATVTMIDGSRTTEFSSERSTPSLSPQNKAELCARLQTATASYGSICLTGRDGASDYSLDDERIIQTLAAQAALAYENLLLYEKVRHEARHRELLLESTGDGIYSVDNDGCCTMANHVAASLLGRSRDELIGSPIHELIHHHDPDHASTASACPITGEGGRSKPASFRDEIFLRKDGTSLPVKFKVSPIVDEGEVLGAVITFSDITERRGLERRLEQADRINSLGRMAATIGHEFNNVLMGIQPFAEVIRRRTGEDVTLQQAATQILNSVGRGKSITQDIMRMTRTAEPSLQIIDVSQWLAQLVVEIRAVVTPTIELAVEMPPRGTLFAFFDPAQMQQVVTNLALNARDAIGTTGTITLSAGRDRGMVCLAVGDDGAGIGAESLPFIFEPLFTTKQSGTGLGLAVAHQMVVRNGGAITVETAVGAGTWFRIELSAVERPLPIARSEMLTVSRRAMVRRVVVVEDDFVVAAGLCSMLESEDIEVRVVNFGREAMNAVDAFEPDAVIIDVGLPDVSGTVVYEQIAAKWPAMGVVFSTGHADESLLVPSSSRHLGFLRKPYSSETLMSKLQDVV